MSDRDLALAELHGLLGRFPLRRRRIVREIASHLDQAAADAVAGGMSIEEAERQALARLGSIPVLAGEFARDMTEQRGRRLSRWLAVAPAVIGLLLLSPWLAELWADLDISDGALGSVRLVPLRLLDGLDWAVVWLSLICLVFVSAADLARRSQPVAAQLAFAVVALAAIGATSAMVFARVTLSGFQLPGYFNPAGYTLFACGIVISVFAIRSHRRASGTPPLGCVVVSGVAVVALAIWQMTGWIMIPHTMDAIPFALVSWAAPLAALPLIALLPPWLHANRAACHLDH